MMKDYLETKITKLSSDIDSLTARAMESDDLAEVKDIHAKLEEKKEELAERKAELEAMGKMESREIPAKAQKVDYMDGQTVASFKRDEAEDMLSSMEYRKAFMAYAQKGEAIPAKYQQRDGSPANTTTLGATIPTTVMNEFINEIREVYGNLYNKVRKLNVKGAVKFPIAKLEASFKWITEDTVSPRQDAGEIKDYVEFSYNMAEIRVSQTLLSQIVSLDIFEREVVQIMLKAYLKAMDTGIVKGTGNGQMLGILNDARVTNVVELTASEFNNWTAWRKKFFAKLPLGYRAGEFIFPLATVDAYLETMADSNNNPIFRQATGLEVNDGDAQYPSARFFGREVSLVEPDIIPDFDSAENGDVVGIFWQPSEYAINTNMEFGMRRYFDEERNEWVDKMLTVVDGKVLNPKGFYLIKKKGNA